MLGLTIKKIRKLDEMHYKRTGMIWGVEKSMSLEPLNNVYDYYLILFDDLDEALDWVESRNYNKSYRMLRRTQHIIHLTKWKNYKILKS